MEITAALVKKLREETDAPLMECKKALQSAAEELGASATEDAAYSRAKEILRESGKLQAGKRADRSVSQGVIAVSRSGNAAAAVTLLCETDFVARNEDFQALAQKLADYFAQNDPGGNPQSAMIDGKTVQDLLADAVAVIRENIQLGSVKRVEGESVGVYLHHDKMKAALVAAMGGNGEAQDMANKIGTQIVALSPEYIEKTQVDAERLQREIDLEKQRAIESGKPAEMAEKIAQGRVNKEFLQQVVLLEQPWYADLSKKVGEVIGGVKVVRIVRLEAGKAPVDSSLG
ncbi:MAG TPA: translation elongation factor Ts [Fimbriimonadales bacterium]|nr:translation elongation factor Ts [Fimbriimonadales bacterium]